MVFNHLLLVTCICIVVSLILFFFYWNRFIAYVIGQVIRILYWNQEASSVWVEIGSIHFSLLAGRLLLKDVRYHSSNQTVKIVKGQIQWRYWIRRPTSEEEINSAHEEESNRLWSCRIQLSFQGLEWFLYNRTAAYDDIIAQMEKASRPTSRASSQRIFSRSSQQESASPFYFPHGTRDFLQMPAFVRASLAWFRQQLPSLDPKDMLPLGIDIQTGAIILGNHSTPNLLVAEFRNAWGTYGIVPSRSPHDLYKQVLGLKIDNAQAHFVQNDDFVDPMTTLGGVIHGRIQQHAIRRKPYFYQPYRLFIKLWRQMKLYGLTLDYFSTRRGQRLGQHPIQSSMSGHTPHRKVVDEDTPIGIDFSKFEYAVERKILEAPILELTYYADVVGEVPTPTQLPGNATSDISGEGNPEWGFDIIINGGFLRYGPWADRQRAEIQKAFFPPSYQNMEPSPKPLPGDKRTYTTLQLFIELRDETTLHIPFREPSKDWQWDGMADIPHRPRKRECASINLVVGDCSSINFVMPMITGPSGYESTLEVHLDTIVLTSSLDDIPLINLQSCRIHGELPSPILWNAERSWLFTVFLRQPIMYMLRDHIDMFIDLGKDWASGPPADYQKFIPIIYSIKLELHHFELNLYANDQNIVDKPLIKDENALYILRGPHLKMVTEIPLTVFTPESTSIPFSFIGRNTAVDFSLPRWSTHALHAPKKGITLLHTESLNISGSYLYFAEVREENVEQLKLDFKLHNTVFKSFGWSIRYFMVLRDNYLGSFTHFQTLYEYLQKRKEKLPLGDPIWLKYRTGKSNMLQAQLFLHVQRLTVSTPMSLMGHSTWTTTESQPFNRKDCFAFTVPELQFQFRMHDFYMEMSLNLDVITGSFRNDHPVKSSTHSSNLIQEEVLKIDGIDITTNRLFGPQPRTLAYVCIWEIVVGNVKASLSAHEAKALLAVGNAFRLNFVDLVNSPAAEYLPPADPDVTFLKITVRAMDLTWKAGLASMVVSLEQGLKFDSNDLGAHHYRRVTSIRIPHISSKVLLTASTERNVWLEAAEIIFDAYLDIYSAPKGHRLTTRAQTTFVEEQDRLTGRAKRMFDPLRHRSRLNSPDRTAHKNDLYLPQPTLPTAMNKIISVHQERQPRARSSLWTSRQGNLSDSEDEAGESEADRDARLARTRASTPVTDAWQDDDMIMSSGDESDNADLTDGSSSGDEWSDIGDTTNIQINGSLLSFYSPLTRHYAANTSRIEGKTFTLTRETMFKFHEEDKSSTKTSTHHSVFTNLEGISKDIELTAFRVACQRNVLITVTPLILPAFIYLEEDIKKIRADPGICIDFFLQKCIEEISAKDIPKSVIFDVILPDASIFILQHVAMSDGLPDIYKAMESSNIPSNLDITVVANLRISGAHVVGCSTPEFNSFKGSIDKFTAALGTSIDKRTLTFSLPDSSIFQFILTSLTIQLSRRSLSATLTEFLIRIGHRGPELITATLIALVSTGTRVAHLVQGLKSHDTMTKRAIVRGILMASGEKPVIDPLSTIQPSYLVQTGTPHLLRTELKFKLFYHLRHCVWDLKDQGNVWPTADFETISAEELMPLVEARLILLDQDACNDDQLTLLRSLFLDPSHHSATIKSGNAPLGSFSLCITRSAFVVLDPMGGPSSEVYFKDVVFKTYTDLFDLVQSSFKDPTSTSQTSLRAKPPRVVQKMMVVLSLSEATLTVLPHLMHFTQYILRVKRQYSFGLHHESPPVQDVLEKSSNHSAQFSHVEIMIIIHHLRAQAAAENLVLVVGMRGLQTSSSLLTSEVQRDPSMNHSVRFKELYLQARSPADPSKENDLDVLAGLTFTNGRTSLVSRPEPSKTNLKLTFILTGLRLHVPRSALRLYRFVEEWRADYLPGMEAAMSTLLSEYKGKSAMPPSPTPSSQSQSSPILQLHAQINHLEIVLQVMHGTWLSWESNNIVTYFQSSNNLIGSKHTFGLQISSMILNISATANSQDLSPDPRVKLVLPPLSLAGHSDGHDVHTLVLFEAIELKVKPSHWDTLLAVQQKFGQDFNDLVALMQKTRHKSSPADKPGVKKQMTLKYGGYMKMRGFRIGLEGLSSTVYLECQDINGGISNTNEWAWEIGLSNLALSLAPRGIRRQVTTFDRNPGSAFVTIDFNISAVNKEPFFQNNLQISVSKIHAVMQPSSMGEVGDFIDDLQAEMLERQEQRALELAAFKEKTQSILRTFDVNVGDVELKQSSWISGCIITISIQGVGVAFPLSHDEDLELPRTKRKSQDSSAVGAFLLSIKSIEFGTHRGETGKAVMQRLSFQFVSRFRQSVPEDFIADRHQTRNRLVYPEMKAQLRSSSTGSARKIWVGANVSGFILDLDSTIPNYVFALIDVYRRGKERVERLSANVPRTSGPAKPSYEKHYTAIPTSNIVANLTFLSGKVRLYSGNASSLFKSKSLTLNTLLELSDEQVLGLGAEVFNLPMVSVWAEYRATPASQKRIQVADHDPSVVIFKSTVHSSQNTLRPTLLPFLNELMNHVETRMRKVSSTSRPVVLTPLSSTFSLTPKEEKMESASSMQICFSLRIDRSKLELTCQPDVNVVAGLYWESGGFVVNVSPGAQNFSFSGSVSGLTVGLKHGFLSEDCVNVDARNLGFSVNFTNTESGTGNSVRSISVVLDTELLGGVRFSRLQDVLCFKAVWLDRIPIFNTHSPETTNTLQPTIDEQAREGLATVILIRIRCIKLHVDLGQSISRIDLELQQAVFRTKLTGDSNEVFIFVGDLSFIANGNLSGRARVPSCVFQTIRRSEGGLSDDRGRSRMLELRLTSGELTAVLESDRQQLLHYCAKPLEVEIFDDWSIIHTDTDVDGEPRPLKLSFTITSPEVIAVVAVGTVPKLLAYIGKFKANLDAQQQGAFRESQTFRVTRTPKPENALSAVAEAMIHSARDRLREAEAGFSYMIHQHMSLHLDLLRLIVFPRTMDDVEIAQFIGRDVRARLDRCVGFETSSTQRDMLLSFSSMIISKYTQVGRPNPPTESEAPDVREWVAALLKDAAEAIIVGLPSMTMSMISEETIEESVSNLVYDFHSEFIRREGMKAFEDIYITLNMSLYSWLTVLRKNLTREMDQVRSTEVWRTSMSNTPAVSPALGSFKKKVPEPLSLVDFPKSSNVPSASAFHLSNSASSSGRFGWLEHSRSPTPGRELLSPISARDFLSPNSIAASPVPFPSGKAVAEPPITQGSSKKPELIYHPRKRHIERLTMRQLGEATPDVMHPFFMKKAGFNLEDSLPQYVNEYAIGPIEEIMEFLLKLYSQQLIKGGQKSSSEDLNY